MLVLVTGLDGFTGKYVNSQLTELGHTVIGLHSNLLDFNSLNEEIKKIQPEAILHLAGKSFVAHSNTSDFYNVNLIGTYNLLKALDGLSIKLKSILLASSASVYGDNSREVISEKTIPAPLNDYAVSKLSMEYMAKLFMASLPIFIVRPFNYTGVGQNQDFLIPKIVEHFRKKKSIIELGNIDIYREFNDVRNIAAIYVNLLIFPPSERVLNITSGRVYSIKHIIKLCQEITGHQIIVKNNPKFCSFNDAKKLSGSSLYLEKYTKSNINFSIRETLTWMLEQG